MTDREPVIIEKACWERGCACYDHRVDEGVKVTLAREWVGLTPEDKRMAGIPLHTEQISISDAFDVIERILKEKNHDMS